jgi:hypothetical protein
MRIDCDECLMCGTAICRKCVVTFIVGRDPGDALVIDAEEERALHLLVRAGMLPDLRHVARAVPADPPGRAASISGHAVGRYRRRCSRGGNCE